MLFSPRALACVEQTVGKPLMSMIWGLSGPEQLGSERRTRTLNIGAAIREYNERAVPGMGGVWYAKQLLLAMLGIALAQKLRERMANVSNIEAANAIEALGCYYALKQSKGQGDARVRGSEKLRGKSDFNFQTLCKPGFYVSQPMRMGTGQALLVLGMVRAQGERFNAFTCTAFGHEFVNACCGDDGALLEELVQWAQKGSSVDKLKSPIPELLSPLQVLPAQARTLLSRRIDTAASGGTRRTAIRRWVLARHAESTAVFDWSERPDEIDPEHWNDLHYGALFFQVQDAAYDVLNAVEQHMAVLSTQRFELGSVLPERISTHITHLREMARLFLDNPQRQRTDPVASTFCHECIDPDSSSLLASLVSRDGRVLRLQGKGILPGGAFQHQVLEVDTGQSVIEAQGEASQAALPAWISHRVGRLHRLDLDLQGQLSAWLTPAPAVAIEEVSL